MVRNIPNMDEAAARIIAMKIRERAIPVEIIRKNMDMPPLFLLMLWKVIMTILLWKQKGSFLKEPDFIVVFSIDHSILNFVIG